MELRSHCNLKELMPDLVYEIKIKAVVFSISVYHTVNLFEHIGTCKLRFLPSAIRSIVYSQLTNFEMFSFYSQ